MNGGLSKQLQLLFGSYPYTFWHFTIDEKIDDDVELKTSSALSPSLIYSCKNGVDAKSRRFLTCLDKKKDVSTK